MSVLDLDPSCIQRLSGKCPTTVAGKELNISRELLYTDRLIVDNYCKINITNTTCSFDSLPKHLCIIMVIVVSVAR